MSNEIYAKWSNTGEHPTDDELLCFVDGEQTPAESEALQFHLKACWTCRARAEKLNEAIMSFVEFRGQYVKPILKSTHNRGNFNQRLNKAVAEMKTEVSAWARWRSLLGKFGSAVRRQAVKKSAAAGALRRVTRFSPLNFLQDEYTRRLFASASAAVLLFSILFTYLFLIPSLAPVSAEELLDKTSAARAAQLKNRELPVVYQQLLIKRRTRAGENTVKAEIWQDETNSRVRRTTGEIDDNSAKNSPTSTLDASDERLLTGLEEILRTNNFVPARPFSVAGFRAWRKTLTGKAETVEKDVTADGAEVWRLKTEAVGEALNGKLLTATIVVRSGDYHPVEQNFLVKTADGEEEYTVREQSFAVISLNSLTPNFFGDKPASVLVPHANSKPEVVASPASSASPSESPAVQSDAESATMNQPILKTESASPELEVEVLELLHQAGADLGEQVEVVRDANGSLVINGVVETADRKKQLFSALRSYKDNRAVRINIQTAEEAITAEQRKKQNNKSSAPVVQMETRQIEGVSFPAEARVKEHYAKQGGDAEKAVKQYALRTVNRSAQAMRFLYALKRLTNQIKADDFGKLKPDARHKLLNLIKNYARSYKNEIVVLRGELQPVFGGGGAGSGSAINNDAELFSAIGRMFESGATIDRAVSSALVTGRDESGAGVLQSAEFRRNLAAAEAIAEALQNVK